MTLFRNLVAALSILMAIGPLRAEIADKALPIPVAEQARVVGAEVIGRLLYDYDQAAWITTDAMMARVSRDHFPPDGGWIVEPRPDGALVVTYYGIRDGRTFVMFIAAAKGGKVIEQKMVPESDALALTAAQSRIVEAKNISRLRLGGTGHRPCANAPFNAIALAPAAPDAPVIIYYLTPQVQTGTYPAGGHFRIDVAKDGTIAVDRAFTNACLDLPPPPSGAEMAYVTHLLDPTPTEIHVYLSLWMNLPLMVGTSDRRAWLVKDGRINLVSNDLAASGRQ